MAAKRMNYRDAKISIDGVDVGTVTNVKLSHLTASKTEKRARLVISHVKKDRLCAYCNRPVERVGEFSIHRDAMSEGPEVPLCASCAVNESPTLADIWARIGQATYCRVCSKDIRPGDERAGSFHAWCYEKGI